MIETNLKSFLSDLKQFEDLPKKAAVNFKVTLIKNIHSELISAPGGNAGGTPIDTGRARGSWAIEQGRVGSFVLPEAPTKSHPYNGPRGRLYYKYAAVKAYQGIVTNTAVRLGETWYVYNRVPYIRILNSTGTNSNQAGPKFVESAVLRAEKRVEKAISKRYQVNEYRKAMRALANAAEAALGGGR